MRKNGQMNYVPDSLVMPKHRKPSKKLMTIRLDCSHELLFRANTPAKGDLLWCFPCDGYRERVA